MMPQGLVWKIFSRIWFLLPDGSLSFRCIFGLRKTGRFMVFPRSANMPRMYHRRVDKSVALLF